MTSGIPGRSVPGPTTPKRTTPTARISRAALQVNLRAVLASTPNGVIDVRADAWGHGIEVVAPLALAAGAAALLADEPGVRALERITDATRVVVDGVGTAPNAVYGLSPGFTPALCLSGWVLSLKALHEGEGVSYGFTYRAPRETTVALVTGGYAQGVVRSLGNAVSVLIAGERHRIVGRVAMDVCVVDIGSAAVAPGEEAVFFGRPAEGDPALADWAAATGMTPGELVTAVGLRNPREYTP
ncbi:alanine racemase [Microbacterium sp.]|uniref:alanine racemase n=1 Tax=Microbacterium sp. TaxID=51671 RepID=UPI002E32B644|nr:alanine racemase C-terminal domain-containing protein [Microbacterium sp.]HEX5729276.1 alanine racemase C-terminal domain-containing protein [Microbacterium sp.]